MPETMISHIIESRDIRMQSSETTKKTTNNCNRIDIDDWFFRYYKKWWTVSESLFHFLFFLCFNMKQMFVHNPVSKKHNTIPHRRIVFIQLNEQTLHWKNKMRPLITVSWTCPWRYGSNNDIISRTLQIIIPATIFFSLKSFGLISPNQVPFKVTRALSLPLIH